MKPQTENACAPKPQAALLTLLAAGLFLGGCVVTSVYPFYLESDLVFEPTLVGDWVDADNEPKPGEFIRVSRLGELGYLATAFTPQRTNSEVIHLFRLKQQLFLDTCPTNDSLGHIPVHQISKVVRLEPELVSAGLNYDWLNKLVKQHPKAIRHIRVREKPDETGEGRLVLTPETPELQKFILKQLNNTNAWQKPSRVGLRPH